MRPLRAPLLTLVLALACLLPLRAEPWSAAEERVGPLRLGMPAAEVQSALGKPEEKGAWIDEAATGLQVQEWSYRSRGLFLTLSRDGASSGATLERFRVVRPCGFETSRAVKVGDSAAAVRAAYGGLLSEESTATSLIVGSIYDGVIFSLEGGRVREIFVGAAAE